MAETPWWRNWEFGRQSELTEPEISEVRAQPRFHDALRHSIREALRLAEGDREFQRTIADAPSLILGLAVLYLDATGGLTHSRLRDLAGIKGALSAGRVSAMLLRLRMIGYIHAGHHPGPGLAKIYRPTAKMIAVYRARWRIEFESLRILAPTLAHLVDRFDQPEGLGAFMSAFGATALNSLRSPPPIEVRSLIEIGTRHAGNLVIGALLETAADTAGRFPSAGPAHVSIAALARRFHVSRTQILMILRDAVAGGYYTRGATEGQGEVQPALVEAVEIYYAAFIIGVAGCARFALGDATEVRAVYAGAAVR